MSTVPNGDWGEQQLPFINLESANSTWWGFNFLKNKLCQLKTSWVAGSQGRAPAVPLFLVSVPMGLAHACTKNSGQITCFAETGTLFRGKHLSGYTANNCSVSVKDDGRGDGKEKRRKQTQIIVILSAAVWQYISPQMLCVLLSSSEEGLVAHPESL